MAKIRMKDVAERIGVSTVSVSKALNGKEGVGEEIRQKIIETANEMGYELETPTIINKPLTIGVLIADRFFSVHDAFYGNIHKELVKIASTLNVTILLEIITKTAETNCILPNFIQNRQIEGLIYLGTFSNDYIEHINTQKIPFVFLDFFNDDKTIDSVVSDNYNGSYAITNLLIQNGHKNIRFVGTINATSSIFDRYMGYLKAIIANDLLQTSDISYIPDRNDLGETFEEYNFENLPDAFVCNCDQSAFYLINSLKDNGYKIPEDVSLVGFDNSYFATISSPLLTTYRVNIKAMAATAIRLLIKKINHEPHETGKTIIYGELIIRDTVKKIPVK